MRSRLGPLMFAVAVGFAALASCGSPPASAFAGSSAVRCARATTTTITATTTTTRVVDGGAHPSEGQSCWEEVPYPFISEGEEANRPSQPSRYECILARGNHESCYLTVTSMAFRAWNRGIAVTEQEGLTSTPPEIWLYNGEWRRDGTFSAQSKNCTGNTVLWAGKLDYWLVGASQWGSLCRFDGLADEWTPVPVPSATKQRATGFIGAQETPFLRSGTVTSGACFAWNNCWFFGSYGTVLHWSERVEKGLKKPTLALRDASPTASETLLWGEYTAAVARAGAAGGTSALAVRATSEGAQSSTGPEAGPLRTDPAEVPPQLFGSPGQAFGPLELALPDTPQPADPFRTDLVAVDIGAEGQAWVAGNPASLHVRQGRGGESPNATIPPQPSGARPFASHGPQPAPLQPVTEVGGETGCADPPPPFLFTYTPFPEATQTAAAGQAPGAFLWSDIAALPGGEALGGGEVRRPAAEVGPAPGEGAVAEPVIAQVGCAGRTSLTRFSTQELAIDGSPTGSESATDRGGAVTALVANAANDAWAATSFGVFASGAAAPPHLYHLTNGSRPEAPEGNDEETRPGPEPEEITYVFEPPPPTVTQPPPAVTKRKTVKLPPALYDVKTKLHQETRGGRTYLNLYISFRVRRPVKVGAQALRNGQVVSVARAKRFRGKSGVLILQLDRSRWPSKIRFVS